MAKMPVEIIDLRVNRLVDLLSAMGEANQVQDEIDFSMLPDSYADALRLNVFNDIHTVQFFDVMMQRKKEWRGFHPFIISFVESSLHSNQWSNLFSSRRSEEGLALVTSSAVESEIVPIGRMVAYYLYELAIHSLSFIVPGRKNHKEARGCVFDFKEYKAGILDSMRAGSLCDECRAWLIHNGTTLSPAQLAAFDHLLNRTSELLMETPQPRSVHKPRIFVGSSFEGLEVARALQYELQYDYSVEIWNQNTAFGLGAVTIEALEKAVQTYDYGIFVFTSDDIIQIRGVTSTVPRDNVVFETGLFVGKLGRFRSFIVHPKDGNIQLPSDLRGLTTATFDQHSPNMDAAIGPACRQIRIAIANMG